MPTIIATWGGTGSNAYSTLSEVETYVAGQILDATAWTSATTEVKQKAILRATRDIDVSRLYVGRRRYANQSLEFPRAFFFEDEFARLADPTAPDEDDIFRIMQERVKNACAEQAVFLVKNIDSENADAIRQARGITSFSESIGPLSESVSYGGGGKFFSKLSPETYQYLRYYQAPQRMVRGSAFDGSGFR